MTQNQGKTILITGANTGLGKEMARQLALRGDFERIYLGCRNPEKAERAKQDLETVTGRTIFEVVIIDLEDLASVRAAVAAVGAPLNALVMNAGGTGGPTPAALTQDGVTASFAQNVLGHVVLLEDLLAAGLLTDVAVLVGSEAARGVPEAADRPTNVHRSQLTGVRVGDRRLVLSGRQLRRDARLRPGQVPRRAVDGRDGPHAPRAQVHHDVAGKHRGNRGAARPARARADHRQPDRAPVPRACPSHRAQAGRWGRKRLVNAVTDASLRSGVFYASAASKITGPVIDQAEIVPDFRDPEIQDHAYEAIQRFVRRSPRLDAL